MQNSFGQIKPDASDQDPTLLELRQIKDASEKIRDIARRANTLKSYCGNPHGQRERRCRSTFVSLFRDLAHRAQEDDALRFDLAHTLDVEFSKGADNSTNPQINEVSFSTLMGKPPQGNGKGIPQKEQALKYLRSATGLNDHHYFLPKNPTPQGLPKAYNDLTNTMLAVESFGAYVLSERYADSGVQRELDSKLAQSLSDYQGPDIVANEPIGKVQRQTLMFASRNYLQQARLIQLQQDLLTAQVMANTLTMANMKLQRRELYDRIMSAPPYDNSLPPAPFH